MTVVYRIRGRGVVSRDEWCAGSRGWQGGPAMGTVAYSESRPLISEGLGCLRHQVPELRELIRRFGIFGARVLDNGAVEFTSRRGRRDLLRARGLVDADGGYGDG